jgi:hypothetical protein
MPDQFQPTETLPVIDEEPRTSIAEQPLPIAAHAAPGQADPDTDIPPDDRAALHMDDPDDSWQTGPVRRGIRLRVVTALLIALIAVAEGFWGGAVAEKHHNSSSGTSGIAAALRSFATTRGGFAGASSATAGGTAVTGLVDGVKGQKLVITETNSSTVTVTLAPTGTVIFTGGTGLAGLQVGQTVTVRGTAGPAGTFTATAVTEGSAFGGGTGAPSGGTAG